MFLLPFTNICKLHVARVPCHINSVGGFVAFCHWRCTQGASLACWRGAAAVDKRNLTTRARHQTTPTNNGLKKDEHVERKTREKP